MSAEEAIARAKAIAARLAGTGATLSTAPTSTTTDDNVVTNGNISSNNNSGVAVANNDVNSVAEAALAAAFGVPATGGADGDGSGSKRKRWGDTSGKSLCENWIINFFKSKLFFLIVYLYLYFMFVTLIFIFYNNRC